MSVPPPSPNGAVSLAALRHVKRARGLLRDAGRELAQSGDLDTVAHVRVANSRDIDELRGLLMVALTEHRDLDVIVVAANNPTARNGQRSNTP